jgi:hypothetical protein
MRGCSSVCQGSTRFEHRILYTRRRSRSVLMANSGGAIDNLRAAITMGSII